jgi:hypothetical protein
LPSASDIRALGLGGDWKVTGGLPHLPLASCLPRRQLLPLRQGSSDSLRTPALVDSAPSPDIRARRAEVARRYAWDAKRRRGSRNIAIFRRAEIDRLFADRYGPILPDDDAGRADLLIMLHHFATGPGHSAERLAKKWAAARAPWLPEWELEPLLKEAMANPRRWRADELGKELGLTATTRQFLRIRTIGACDMSKRDRQRLRKERKRFKEAERRRAKGMTSRSVSLSRLEPWKAEGISRRTWYRRQAAAKAEAAV